MRLLACGAGMLVTSAVFGQETWLDCNNFREGVELKVGFDQQARWVEIREKSYIFPAREFSVTPGKVFGDIGISTMDIDRVSGKFIFTRFTRMPGDSSRSVDKVTEGDCIRAVRPPAAAKF